MFDRRLWTRELVAWYVTDFANSLININIVLYLSQWFVVDHGINDAMFAAPTIIATILLVFSSSVLGMYGDRRGTHPQLLLFLCSITAIVSLGIVVSGTAVPSPFGIWLALVSYGLYQLSYQLALVPYAALLKHISTPELYGQVSGIGYAAGQIGNIAGLLLTIPVAKGALTLFGAGRLAPVFAGVVAFALFCAVPYCILRKRRTSVSIEAHTIARPATLMTHLRETKAFPGVRPLLFAYYLFSDAMNTVTLFSAIYLAAVFGVNDAGKVTVFLIVLVATAIGAGIAGTIADRYGHRRVLSVSLLCLAGAILMIASLSDIRLLQNVFGIFGLTTGVVYATSRSLYASLIPVGRSGQFFGLYTFAERFASATGPLAWSAIILLVAGPGPLKYRLAMATMGVLVLLALVPLHFLQSSNRDKT